MTPFPHAVSALEEVETAEAMFQQYGIHHLPVMRDHQLVGILSEADVLSARAVLGQLQGPLDLVVWSICTRDPYIVDLHTPLNEVCDQLANRHIGSALVTKNDKLAGIITNTDLLRHYAALLREVAQDPPLIVA